MHVPIEPEHVQPSLPPGVHLQTFNGTAWLGIVPFRMSAVAPRPLPFFFPSFPELNLRTYVEVDNKPGVWFFSLDATNWLVVFGGRRVYQLPYHHARIRLARHRDQTTFRSLRMDGQAIFAANYGATGSPFLAEPGTFEHWATERYCLYALSHRGLVRVDVHHPPWPLQPGRVLIKQSTLLETAGFEVPLTDPIVHVSSGVEVISYPVQPAANG